MNCNLIFDSISGTPPFNIYVTDAMGYFPPVNIGPVNEDAVYPISLELPAYITTAPLISITMVDADNCDTTIIIDNSGTTTNPMKALLLIEPKSLSTDIQAHLLSEGNSSFLGFWQGSQPISSVEMNRYLKMFVNGSVASLPSIIEQDVPQTTGGNDPFMNPIVANNFMTTRVLSGAVSEDAWYTWIIPDPLLNGGQQTEISYGEQNSPHIMSVAVTNPTLRGNSFNYDGNVYFNGFYRLYTTYPSTEFLMDNTEHDIYFKGTTVI